MDPNYEQAQQMLIYILMIATPMYLVNRLQTDSLAGRLLINIIAFMMCISVVWLLVLFCSFLYIQNSLFVIVLPACILVLLFAGYRLLREWGLDKRFVYAFLGYVAAIFVVTLFARIGRANNDVRIDVIAALINAVTMRDMEATEHLVLNTVMFIPFGVLYPLMAPPKKQKQDIPVRPGQGRNGEEGPVTYEYRPVLPEYQPVKYGTAAVFLGIAYSGIIESIQLTLSLGECDMADVFANGLGAFIGVLLSYVVRRFVRPPA